MKKVRDKIETIMTTVEKKITQDTERHLRYDDILESLKYPKVIHLVNHQITVGIHTDLAHW